MRQIRTRWPFSLGARGVAGSAIQEMEAKRSALSGARPLFLIGAPRSGTTILANLLNAHRRVLLTHETAVFLQLDAMIRTSRVARHGRALFGKTYHELWASHLKDNARHLIESFYARIAEQQNRGQLRYWGEKHPHLESCLPWIQEMYPDATYLYAIRDPRDTACSIAKMNGIAVSTALDKWTRFAGIYEAFVESAEPNRVKTVRYEYLVFDYESVISDALAFLGLGMDDHARAYLAEHKNKSSHNPASPRQLDYSQNSVGRWQRDMTGEEQAYALTKCEVFMRRHGYLE